MRAAVTAVVLLVVRSHAATATNFGYLLVTNRGDEAVFAARSLRGVAPRANVTFVSDAATLRDVGDAVLRQTFDVVIRAEDAMPDLDVHDSMGFRLQKLRGALASPYCRRVNIPQNGGPGTAAAGDVDIPEARRQPEGTIGHALERKRADG